jgi:hypothetical protein
MAVFFGIGNSNRIFLTRKESNKKMPIVKKKEGKECVHFAMFIFITISTSHKSLT